MMLDQLAKFLDPNGPAMSAVAAAGVNLQVGNIYDIMGIGVGAAPPNIIGNASLFGEDIGIGIWKPNLQINIGTAFTTSNSATANFALQGAPDTGSTGSFLPGTWETICETGPKTATQLTPGAANSGVYRLEMTATPPDMPTPRYLRILMQVPSATNFTAGTILGAFAVMGRDDLQNKFAAPNYLVR